MTMQVAHVGLRNLRSYRAAELHLGPGTTLLSGDIGSGKTSLLYAMEMALFGFAEVDAGYLIRHGARDAEVSLTLTDGTHRWELRRRFVRKARKGRDAFEPTENSLAVDGQRATYSATELRRRTIELLGFPDNPNPRAHSDVWRWAVYLAQERMRDVLDPDVDVRMETVRKALGVEQYRLAGENARGLARSLEERATDLSEQATRHRGVEEEALRWRGEGEMAQRQVTELDTRERGLREEMTRIRARLEEADRQRREFETAREAVTQQERLAEELDRSIQQDRAALQLARERLSRLQAELAHESANAAADTGAPDAVATLRARRDVVLRRLSDLEGLKGQASAIEEQRSRWAERESELKARQATTFLELAQVRADRGRLDTTEPVAEPRAPGDRSLDALQIERRRLEEALRTLDRELATATAELHELAEIVREGVCPRCHRPVEASEFEAHRREQETLVAGIQRQLDEASQRVRTVDDLALARLEYDRMHDRWQQLDLRRADLRQREAALETHRAEEDSQVAQLEGERVGLEARRSSFVTRLAEYEQVRDEVGRVDRAIVQAEALAQAAAARAERVTSLERQIPEVRAEIELRGRNEAERVGSREEVRRQIEAGRALLRAPAELEATWRTVRVRADELERSLQDLLREMSGPKGRLAEATARLDELARRQRERETLDRQAAQLNVLAGWIDKEFRNAMLELERRRLQQGRLQFERRFAQYFAALVEDPSLSARVDETFAPWVDIAGQSTPAEALSGGERTALALAYRLALGRTVRDAGRLTLETLILDEPTEGFSQEQTLRMGDLLEGLGLPQVILVSHERQLEGIADRVIRIRKKDGVSSIEEAEPASGNVPTPVKSADTPRPPAEVPARRRKIRKLTDLESPATGDGLPQAR